MASNSLFSDLNTLAIAFNKQVTQLLNQLEHVFNNEISAEVMHEWKIKWQTITSLTPDVPVIAFYKKITIPYSDCIKNKDSTFFNNIKENYGITNMIKVIYEKSTNKNKDVIWKYIKTLMALSTYASKHV